MQIVFLCGGLGTRLNSISNGDPKSLIKINGKPFLKYILDRVIPYNPSSIHFCLGYKSKLFLNFFQTLSFKNTNLTYSIEDANSLLGTGGAIKNALKFLDKNFIVQYGDTMLNLSYEDLFNEHIKTKKKMTMSILNYKDTNEIPNVFCKENLDGKNVFLYDKLNPPLDSNFIDYGAIVFRKNVFTKIKEIKFDLSEIQRKLTYENQSGFYKVDHPYIEIGTPKSFLMAKKLLK